MISTNVYLVDKTCNLVLVFLVLCHRQQTSHLDTSCSFQQRGRRYPSKNLLKRINNGARLNPTKALIVHIWILYSHSDRSVRQRKSWFTAKKFTASNEVNCYSHLSLGRVPETCRRVRFGPYLLLFLLFASILFFKVRLYMELILCT